MSGPATSPFGSPIRALEPLDELRPPPPGAPVAALTVDLEDWYQSCIDFDAPISDRVVRNTTLLLQELDAGGVRATFFVQGLVALAYPGLIRDLAGAGHEVQSHAHTHRPLDQMDPAALREEIERGKAAVEDAAGVAVTAFRAPDFTIGSENLSALELLAELEFQVDSSIFPLRMRRYGIGGWELAPHRIELESGANLIEAPVAIWRRGPVRLPVAGGGYVRLAPGALLGSCLRDIAAGGRPPIIYCHPYEFSPDELADYRGQVPERFRRVQGLGRKAFVKRLRHLFRTMRFGRLDEVLASWGVASVPRQHAHELPAES